MDKFDPLTQDREIAMCDFEYLQVGFEGDALGIWQMAQNPKQRIARTRERIDYHQLI